MNGWHGVNVPAIASKIGFVIATIHNPRGEGKPVWGKRLILFNAPITPTARTVSLFVSEF